jgi:hypothetical protein
MKVYFQEGEMVEEEQLTSGEYRALFGDIRKQKAALEIAHDIRKFEIELYWRRASYFWTTIAAALAGFFLLAAHEPPLVLYSYLVACVGFLFSLAWWAVNRGGSVWQRNWEVHVDLLEDAITGPLHKTFVGHRPYRFWDLSGPYAFSPSRLNTILSVVVTGVWLFLVVKLLIELSVGPEASQAAILTLGTAVAAFYLLGRGRPSKKRMRVVKRDEKPGAAS